MSWRHVLQRFPGKAIGRHGSRILWNQFRQGSRIPAHVGTISGKRTGKLCHVVVHPRAFFAEGENLEAWQHGRGQRASHAASPFEWRQFRRELSGVFGERANLVFKQDKLLLAAGGSRPAECGDPSIPIFVRGPQSFIPNDSHLLRRQRRFAEWFDSKVHLRLLFGRQFGGKTEEDQAFPLIQMVRDIGERWKFFQFVPIGEHIGRGQFAAFKQGQIADRCHVVDGQSDNHMHQEGSAPHQPAESVAGDEIPPGLANLAGADFEQGARSQRTAQLVQRLQADKRKLVQLFADRSDERKVTRRTTRRFDRHLERRSCLVNHLRSSGELLG